MKFNDLPQWAKNKAKKWAENEYRNNIAEAIEAGQDVKPYTTEELEKLVMGYLLSKDDYLIEYDEDGGVEFYF